MYADKDNKNAKAFNCVQRAHQNLLENIPLYLGLLVTSSPFRPEIAAGAGLVRLLGFVFYVRGYASGDPAKRMQGGFGTSNTSLYRLPLVVVMESGDSDILLYLRCFYRLLGLLRVARSDD